MGEVFRARDTRLGRDVALKVLPAAFARDPDRVARFHREAQLLASLNHPHIATVYGLEATDAVCVIAMELVDGPTLAERIAHGPVPLDEAVGILRQIAEAMEAAHEQGIIHRDLKPANVKIRPDGAVKVLDFGLAKALAPLTDARDIDESPTITSPAMTAMGVILGTAAYMAPEQARGKTVDKRADIWAFGCVMYELVTGRRVFEGQDVSDTLAGVLRADPEWTALPDDLPATSKVFLRRCLEKDPRRRVRDIGDVRLALEGAYDTPSTAAGGATAGRRAWVGPAVVAGAILGSALLALAVWNARRPDRPGSAPVSRFAIPLAPGMRFSPNTIVPLAVTPDGRRILFTAQSGPLGENRVYSRAIDQLDALPVVTDETSMGSLFVSPDGEWIGFNRDGPGPESHLHKMRVTGGPVATIARRQFGSYAGATWGRGGRVVFTFGPGNDGLLLVSDAGGTPRQVTTPPAGEIHLHPHFLPDGNGLLFTRRRPGQPDSIAVIDVTTGRLQDLAEGAWPRYAPSGHLLFAREAAMWAAAFDPERLEIRGDSVPVLDDVPTPAAFSFSSTGTVVYLATPSQTGTTLTWVRRDGSTSALPQGPDQYWLPRLSPDGRHLAVGILTDLWIIDLERGARVRLTSGQTSRQFPFTWTRDGRTVTFASPASNRIYRIAADGTGSLEELLQGPHAQWPTDWSSDDRTLAFYVNMPSTARDLWTLFASPAGAPTVFLSTPFQERSARFSPDGRWLAYVSNESGRDEVYVRPYPGPGGQVAISAGGGTEPVWSRTGHELFYRSGNQLMAADVRTLPGFAAAESRPLFENDAFVLELGGVGGNASYDVARDGRFLMLAGTSVPTDVRVVLNWFDELRRLVPVD
jgi:serine/threonine-protein kinase